MLPLTSNVSTYVIACQMTDDEKEFTHSTFERLRHVQLLAKHNGDGQSQRITVTTT